MCVRGERERERGGRELRKREIRCCLIHTPTLEFFLAVDKELEAVVFDGENKELVKPGR